LVLPDLVAGAMTPAMLRNMMLTLTLVLLAGLVLVGGTAPMLIPLLFGPAYQQACLPLWILLPGFVALSLQVLLSQYFAARDFPIFLAGYWLLAVSINVMSNLLLIPRYGMVAAAANSTLSYILVFSLVFLRFRKETGMSCKWPGRVSIFAGFFK
jgi:O-antigen/teichoic acid export membrane protein